MDKVSFIALRKQYGLSQADIAEIIECSRQAVIKWEKGLHPIPDHVEPKLLAADLTAPATKKNASKVLDPKSHPAGYHYRDKYTGYARTLRHPKWWAGATSPFEKLCTKEQRQQLDLRATAFDLVSYVVPTVEQAHALMVARGIKFEDASRYIEWMGHTLPEHLKPAIPAEQVEAAEYNAALARWNATHEPDEQGFGRFEAANPQYRENRNSKPVGEIDPALQKAFDDAFKL
jgi:transcriptional regulator with XRE-family HTH domain